MACARTRLSCVRDAAECVEAFGGPNAIVRHPQVILFGASRPSEFSSEDVEQIHARFPLARLVCLLGSWCEGEMRSGAPLAGMARVYWHQFVYQASHEFSAIVKRTPSNWSLPRTATENERRAAAPTAFLNSARSFRSSIRQKGTESTSQLTLIRTADRISFDTIADPLKRCGLAPVWLMPGEPRVESEWLLGIWDDDYPTDDSAAAIRHFVERIRPAPTILLCGFPRLSYVAWSKSVGVAAILSKPFGIDELVVALKGA